MEKELLNKTNPIPVLVVDDSALMRNLVGKIIASDPALQLAGTARDGQDALEKIEVFKPQAVTLDLEMPHMGGIEFLKEFNKRGFNIPIIILSSLAAEGAAITMEALALGASDFVMKPSGSISLDIKNVSSRLISLIKAYVLDYRRRQGIASSARLFKNEEDRPLFDRKKAPQPQEPARRDEPDYHYGLPVYETPKLAKKLEILCMGISTGGPNALRQIFAGLSKSMPLPLLVVQHMPAGFTLEFARSLNRICPLEVREAKDGDEVKAGLALLAPGDFHMVLERQPAKIVVRLNRAAAINGHRPSVDALFQSAADLYKGNVFAVLMTGMGHDGARGLGSLYAQGALTIAQDEASSVVFGMPKAAIEAGYARKVVALSDMAKTINHYAGQKNLVI